MQKVYRLRDRLSSVPFTQCLESGVVGVFQFLVWTEMAGSARQLTSFFIEDILSMKEETRRTSDYSGVELSEDTTGWKSEQLDEDCLSHSPHSTGKANIVTHMILQNTFAIAFCLLQKR